MFVRNRKSSVSSIGRRILANALPGLALLIYARTLLAAPPDPAAGRIDFPTFGVSVLPPAGWRRATDLPMGQVARWELGGGKASARAILLIEFEPATKLTLAQRVAQMEKQFNGKILEGHAALGGLPAVRLKFPGSTVQLRHEALVAKREGHTYILELHAAAVAKTTDAWQTLLRSWKWTPFEAPAKYLQFSPQPVPLFNGLLTLQGPALLRAFPSSVQTQAKLAVVDNRTDVMALDLDAQVLANPGHLPISQMKDSLATQLQQVLQLPAPVVWKEHAGKTPLFLTDILEPHLAPPAGAPAHTYKPWVRYGLVPITKDRLVLLGFSVTVPTAEERKTYEAVIDRMIDSLTASPHNASAPAQKAG